MVAVSVTWRIANTRPQFFDFWMALLPLDNPILSFHVTSRRPCWRTEQQREKSIRNLILLLCKTLAAF